MIELAKKALKKYFGYDHFRPMQEEIIQNILNKKDCLVVMPTGGGKSICYQIPAIINEGIAIVISPLIALMKDQVESLKSNGIEAAYLNSSQTDTEQKIIEQKLSKNIIKLLYVSPERAITDSFRFLIKSMNISLFAIDEAHCISTWGHDFRPEYAQLNILKKELKNIPFVALTATADKITRKDICTKLDLSNPKIFLASFNRPNLSLKVLPARNRYEIILDFIEKRKTQAGIIYCLSRKTTESIAEKLRLDGINAACYHAGLSAEERNKAQEDFINDRINIICATIAFGMGIDKSNVRWVIHYNLPKNIESYYQEIGRAGRDGLKSETIMFYSYADIATLREFIDDGELKEIQIAKLERIQQYAEAKSCRRKILLSYFNETLTENCNNCDICRNPPHCFNGTIIAQKALSAIARTKEQVPIGMLIDILRGSKKHELLAKNYHLIKTYGAGADISYFDWQHYILQLLNQGYIEIAFDDNRNLKLTEASKKILFEENANVEFVKPEVYGKKEKSSEKLNINTKLTKKERLENELFEILKESRKLIAIGENVPAYIVFSDATLKEMASYRPTTEEELMEINGVGEHKCEKYGKAFIDAIIKYKINEKDKGSSHLLTYEMLKNDLNPEEIAKERNLNIITVYSHIASLYEQGRNIQILSYINEKELHNVIEAIKQIGKDNGLKPLFEYLDEKISYHKIRLAIAYINRNNIL